MAEEDNDPSFLRVGRSGLPAAAFSKMSAESLQDARTGTSSPCTGLVLQIRTASSGTTEGRGHAEVSHSERPLSFHLRSLRKMASTAGWSLVVVLEMWGRRRRLTHV